MKKTFASSLFLLSLLIGISSSANAYEVGLVDEVRILSEFKESADAQTKIAGLRDKMQTLLTSLNDELEKVNADKKATDAVKAQKQKEAEKKLIDEKTKAEEVANSLRVQIENKVKAAINKVAAGQKLDLVLSSDSSFFGGKDITPQVLQELNKGGK